MLESLELPIRNAYWLLPAKLWLLKSGTGNEGDCAIFKSEN